MLIWLYPAVIGAVVLLIASQVWFRRHMVPSHPERMVLPCLNCGKGITPTINGWTHVRMGGFLCQSPGARPPDLRAPLRPARVLDTAASEGEVL